MHRCTVHQWGTKCTLYVKSIVVMIMTKSGNKVSTEPYVHGHINQTEALCVNACQS